MAHAFAERGKAVILLLEVVHIADCPHLLQQLQGHICVRKTYNGRLGEE